MYFVCLFNYFIYLRLSSSLYFSLMQFNVFFPPLFQLLREGSNSTLEILKVAVMGSIVVPIQVSSLFLFNCGLFGSWS